MRVLGVVAARGGSRGIPRKNLQQIADRSLVWWVAQAALGSASCARVILSTDDDEIATEGRAAGLETPFRRPAALATDAASSDDVVTHAMAFVEAEEGPAPYDAVLMLQPTSPFVRDADIDAATEVMERHRARVVLGMCALDVSPSIIGTLDADGRPHGLVSALAAVRSVRRQDLPRAYRLNGAIFLMRWADFREDPRRYADPDRTWAHCMAPDVSIDIDTADDLTWARHLVATGRVAVPLRHQSRALRIAHTRPADAAS